MKRIIFLSLCAGAQLGCSTHGDAGRQLSATTAGTPRLGASIAAINRVDPPERATARVTTTLPNIIEIPSAYRWVIVDGNPALLRETDPRKITAGGAMQIVAGDVSRGEVAIQPALLPQEIAAELTRNRALQAQMITSFDDANRKVAELIAETRTMQERNAQLVQQLATITEYAHQLEQRLASSQVADGKQK